MIQLRTPLASDASNYVNRLAWAAGKAVHLVSFKKILYQFHIAKV
jgi:hypothetical protein